MLVHSKVNLYIKVGPVCISYTWMEKAIVRVKCIAQECNPNQEHTPLNPDSSKRNI